MATRLPTERVCRSCIFWGTDVRKVTVSAACVVRPVVTRPEEVCEDWSPCTGRGAMDPLAARHE